jgi:hypothetical protein
MVKGVMVLMKGFCSGTLYKLLGNVNWTGCNNVVVVEVNSNLNQLNSNLTKIDLNQDELIQTDSSRHHKVEPEHATT